MSTVDKLNEYLTASVSEHDSCLGQLQHSYKINGVNANVRMHYIRFDGNGRPMTKALANLLYEYIIDYCIAAKNRPESLNSRQSAHFTREARKLFRHPETSDESPDKTGEAGEMLLYFLMEAILKAPQVVSKMELKTNHKDEVKGSDGIHANYDEKHDVVKFFFGESKLYKASSEAIAAAIESIGEFHKVEMYQHEFTMVTKHFKFADEATKQAISSFIISGEPGPNASINHACLIGYDFKGYQNLCDGLPKDVSDDFINKFLVDGKRLTNLLQKRFDQFDKKYLNFEVFFIPFPSVVDFRNEFNNALN